MKELDLTKLDSMTSTDIDNLLEEYRAELRKWTNTKAILSTEKYKQEVVLAETKENIRKASVETGNIRSIIETLTSKFWSTKNQ